MIKKIYFISLIATILLSGCNGKKSDNQNDSEKNSISSISKNGNINDKGLEKEKCNCNSVEDCLDKYNFECAREFCSNDKYNCDRKKIIEIESLYWLNKNSYSRSKKIALEIFSVEEFDEIQKNNWYAEKLSDIINAMLNDNKIAEAEIMSSDFPLEKKGDDTYKFKLDALNSIVDAYSNANMKNEKAMIQNKIVELKKSKETENKIREAESKSKILELEKSKEAERKIKESERKNKILELEKEIKQLKLDHKENAKLITKEIAELSINLKDEKKRLEAIRKDNYFFQSNRTKDIDNQTSVINEIENQIESLKSDLLESNNPQITALKEQIRELKLNNK